MTEREIEPGVMNDKGILAPKDSITLAVNEKALIEPPRKSDESRALDDLSNSLTQLTNVMMFMGSINKGRINANVEHEIVMRLETTYTQLEAVWNQYLNCVELIAEGAISDPTVRENMQRQITQRRFS